jgi:hypothetical protein
MWSNNIFPFKGSSFNIPNLIPSSPEAVLLHKFKAASISFIVICFASHSNLSDDPSCISKDRGTNGGVIFDTNSGIQPSQLLTPVEEDLGFRNLFVILCTSDSLVWKFNVEQKCRQDSVFLQWQRPWKLSSAFLNLS